MKQITICLCFIISHSVFGQCLISQGNMFLNYQVAQCNGYIFQSAVGATVSPFGECAEHTYVSIFTTDRTATGITNPKELEKIRIFPNPVHDRLSLTMQNPEMDLKVEILNALGNRIKKFSMPGQHTQLSIDVTHLISGLYYLRLISSSGQQKTVSFTKSSF